VLAAALKEQAQAALVGTLSYGKGTVQEIYLFDNGGRLALTTGQFFTPSGSQIEKIGLFPDFCIVNDKLVNTLPCPQQNGRESLLTSTLPNKYWPDKCKKA